MAGRRPLVLVFPVMIEGLHLMRNWLLAAALLAALTTTQASAEECKRLQRFGTIPFEPDETAHAYLPATISGFKTKLMLDTGAYWSILHDDLVKQLGLKTKKAYFVTMIDASGAPIDTLAVTPEFKLGQLNFGAAEFFVGGGIPGEPLEADGGVVGRNLFTQLDIEFNNAGKAISFFSQDHCPGEGVYWSDEAVVLEYQRAQITRSRGASRIRGDIDKNQIDEPIVSAELMGKPVTVLFDTGATFTAMDLEHAEKVFGITPSTPGVVASEKVYVGSGAQVQTYTYTFKELTISGIRFENVPVRLGQFGNIAQIILGMHEMKHLRMFFAFKEGRIYITDANAGRPAP